MMNKNIKISNADKILFPKNSITKGNIINYYKKIAEYILPHIKDRPLTLQRFPNGISEAGFFQQNISEYFPDWIKSYEIYKKGENQTNHIICNNLDTLIYLANQAMITPHIWLSKITKVNYPDKLIFDLDPINKKYKNIVIIARSIKQYLESMGLNVFVMNTGSSGLHIVVPIKPKLTFDEVRDYTITIAKEIVELNSKISTIEQRKEKRNGKVFIDYLRNSFGQTSVAPYAIRAIESAPVATPLDWYELTQAFNPQRYTIKNIVKRMAQKKDPWKNIYKKQKSLKKAINNF